MDFKDLEKYKPHIPFRIVERDVCQDNEEMRNKLFFEKEDIFIDRSTARLQKGEIQMPVFVDTTLYTFGFGAKLLSYEMENFGMGFYKITQKWGKRRPKHNDRRYLAEEVQKNVFFIAYNRQTQVYQFIETKEKFRTLYQEIETLKQSSEIQQIIKHFYDWMTWFWTPAFNQAFSLGGYSTLRDQMKMIQYLQAELPKIRTYSLLASLFGQISEKSHQFTTQNLDRLETNLEALESELQKLTEVELTKPVNNSSYEQILAQLYYQIQRCFKTRGFFVENGKAYPNLSEHFHQAQVSEQFESEASYQARVQELLNQAGSSSFFAYTPPLK